MEELHKALKDQGEVIISQSPYVAVPIKDEESPESKCEWCFSSSSIKACSACRAVWYCSRECQRSDWMLHRVECKASKIVTEMMKPLTPVMRLLVKLYIRRKLENEKIFPATATDNYKLVEALVSNISELDVELLLLSAQMAKLVSSALQLPDSEINMKEIVENFGKISCNSHSIDNSDLKFVGTGLYPVISFTNHSCAPNSFVVFEGRLAVMRAMQHMPKDTEVLTSYIELSDSTMTRQKFLKEKYCFTCSCSRCIKLGQPDDIRETAIVEGYWCKKSDCDGFLLCGSDNKGFVCQKCGLVRDNKEISTITNELKCISDKASISLSFDTTEASVAYKRVEELELKLYHPFSISIMRTRAKLLKISMDLDDMEGALLNIRSIIQIYERVYPKWHPLIGARCYLCGQIEMELGYMVGAIESLTKAYNVFRITHGTNSPLTMKITSKLAEARAKALASFGRMKI
ncbi:hypothetical protein MIMGU_mgv1a006005mg [Erythranthe guttata]|uniref:MYND-type domain-containing protein n=1 Tax=Erythranthe guttata TaxID=4155 RepID=A0A022Q5L7_ERYGU|nr:hypothetical protein MIMGU_mgv1a006005mg [Erythranthe guttata]